MKATFAWSGAVLLLAAYAPLAQAGGPVCAPALHQPLPQGPDCFGPGFYWTCPKGTVYGPNYYLRPYMPPWNPVTAAQCAYANQQQACPPGMAPHLGFPGMRGPGGGIAVFPSHPFARSPRDFFMVD
jgi:hypothetical protein